MYVKLVAKNLHQEHNQQYDATLLFYSCQVYKTQGDGSVVRSFWFYLNMNLQLKSNFYIPCSKDDCFEK